MNRILTFLVNRLQDLIKLVLFGATIAFVSFLFPRSAQFKYQFELNKPWIYEDLLSPIDFPIYKTEKQLEDERDKVLDQLHPFYKEDTSIYKTIRPQARRALGPLIRDTLMTLSERDEILQNLGVVYVTGILQLDAAHVDYELNRILNLKEEDATFRRRISEFYTLKTAFDEICPPNLENRKEIISAIENLVRPNIVYDALTTQKQRDAELDQIQETEGGILEGQQIIAKGAIVDQNKFQMLESLKRSFGDQLGKNYNAWYVYAGYVAITALLFLILWIFLARFEPDILNNTRKLSFILIIIAVILYLTYYAAKTNLPSIYLVPYCIVPIILRTFFGNRVALYTQILILFLVGFITPYGKEYIFIHMAASLISILANVNAYYWSRFFLATFYIFLVYAVGYLGISLIQEGNFESINYRNLGWLGVNVFLTLLAYPLIPIFEKLFGFISDISLVELGDVNKPVLKELQLEAPGTFQHSLQVGNLAEAAANEIGANGLLVKTAALYHDIGKLKDPIFFIENQNADFNPHDDLEPEESAEIIINHVIDGIEMAKKEGLPDELIDFIRTHHGTSKVEYFYKKFAEKTSEEIAFKKAEDFTYPGPLPYSKETAILMIADTVEAASRSLRNPTSEDINDLVDRLVKDKMDKGQFLNCDLTFKEINLVKRVFKKMLKSIHHIRVSYTDR